MVFVLAADGRNDDVVGAFKRYAEYLKRSSDRFPPRAYELATSDWYFDFRDHRSPHDGWIEEISFKERSSDISPRKRVLSLTVRLLGAYHDGRVELRYPAVLAYSLNNLSGAHGDWRYDELRVSPDGHLIHEIEWSRGELTGHWLIEASDVELLWFPYAGPQTNAR